MAEPEGENVYDELFAKFDSPLMRQIRGEAYEEDIGQHSWVTADEMRADVQRLALGSGSRLLDLGCGPCGPLVFAARASGCRGLGLDSSAAALASGRARAVEQGVEARLEFRECDLDAPLPLESRSFDAAMALDVVLHVRDRAAFFREVARVLVPPAAFLFTDAGVITGPVSSEEIEARSLNGHALLVPEGFNEEVLAAAGFHSLFREDRTASVVRNAGGRRKAILARSEEYAALHGADSLARQLRYLDAVIALSARRALARVLYVAELG